MTVLLLALLAANTGWTAVAEVPSESAPDSVWVDEAGNYHCLVRRDSTDIHRSFNAEGQEIGYSENPVPADSAIHYSFADISIDSEGFSHGIACIQEGDTLWTRDLSFSTYMGEFPGRIFSSSGGGCWAVFDPTVNQGNWRLLGLNSESSLVYETEFQLEGGPVIAVSDLAEMSGGGVVLTGVTDMYGMNLYMVLIGFDEDGELLFSRKDSLRFHGSGYFAESDPLGITVAGYTGSERDDGYFMPPADTDVFLMRFDRSGRELWRSVLDLPLDNRPCALSINDNGAVLVVSSFPEGHQHPAEYSIVDYKRNSD